MFLSNWPLTGMAFLQGQPLLPAQKAEYQGRQNGGDRSREHVHQELRHGVPPFGGLPAAFLRYGAVAGQLPGILQAISRAKAHAFAGRGKIFCQKLEFVGFT